MLVSWRTPQRHSSGRDSHSACQKNPLVSWNPNVQYRFERRSLQIYILNHTNSLHTALSA
jgi:hypothetical protein